MKAGVASEKGIEVRDVPQPRPKPNEVLVKVKAAALNRADLAVARGGMGVQRRQQAARGIGHFGDGPIECLGIGLRG